MTKPKLLPESKNLFTDEQKVAIKAFMKANGLNKHTAKFVQFIGLSEDGAWALRFSKDAHGVEIGFFDMEPELRGGVIYTLTELGLEDLVNE